MCLAIMQLVFGGAQPVFGIIASKTSNRFILIMGAVLVGTSMVGMMLSHSLLALLLSLGILFGLGAGALFGGYTAIWMIDSILCAFASLVSLRIRDGKG